MRNLKKSRLEIHSDSGEKMNAHFEVREGELIFFSRGGAKGTPTEQNTDYSPALLLLLKRLEKSELNIAGIWVDSSRVQGLSMEERSIFHDGDLERSPAELRTELFRRIASVGRSPTSKSRGNPTKRLRFAFSGNAFDERIKQIAGRGVTDDISAGLEKRVQVEANPKGTVTQKNLESEQATGPLTEWLIHTAKSRRTMTYGEAKRRLEDNCGFGTIFNTQISWAANAVIERILHYDSDAPLLNVLLVYANTGLPGRGAAPYLDKRYPGRSWLRKKDADKDAGWRDLVEKEASRVYGYTRWNELYLSVYGRSPSAVDDSVYKGGGIHRIGGEGENHKALKLRVKQEPSLVRRGLRSEETRAEVELLSGDRVDVVSVARDGTTVAIEVKSRNSDWHDLRRGVYQCVKYRAVIAAEDMRQNPKVESWLVTEERLTGGLSELACRLGVRTRVIPPE